MSIKKELTARDKSRKEHFHSAFATHDRPPALYANERDVPYQSLIKMILADRLAQGYKVV